jgi:predicted dehydrogenase
MGAFIDNEIPLVEVVAGDARLEEGPVSTLGTPMALFSATTLPMGHSGAYTVCARTELVAGCDLRQEVLDKWGPFYHVSSEHCYTDYKEMIARERPEIVSVCTQPEHRAVIMLHLAENGVKAIYAEKGWVASIAEADAVVAACARHGVSLNLGTNRRYDPGFDAARALIESGDVGALKSIIVHSTSSLFNGASHSLDAVNRLNGDSPPVWVQAHLEDGDTTVTLEDGRVRPAIDGDILRKDVQGDGKIRYANGVTAYMINSGLGMEVEAICERGHIKSHNNGEAWTLREPRGQRELAQRDKEAVAKLATEAKVNEGGRAIATKVVTGQWDFSPDLVFEAKSSTVCSVEDLCHALDTGENPRGGAHGAVARGNIDLIFGFVESHVHGGKQISMPLLEHGGYRLDRITDSAYGYGNVPKFARTAEELQLAADVDAPLDAVTRALAEAEAEVARL